LSRPTDFVALIKKDRTRQLPLSISISPHRSIARRFDLMFLRTGVMTVTVQNDLTGDLAGAVVALCQLNRQAEVPFFMYPTKSDSVVHMRKFDGSR
jgi:hypothetical protein